MNGVISAPTDSWPKFVAITGMLWILLSGYIIFNCFNFPYEYKLKSIKLAQVINRSDFDYYTASNQKFDCNKGNSKYRNVCDRIEKIIEDGNGQVVDLYKSAMSYRSFFLNRGLIIGFALFFLGFSMFILGIKKWRRNIYPMEVELKELELDLMRTNNKLKELEILLLRKKRFQR